MGEDGECPHVKQVKWSALKDKFSSKDAKTFLARATFTCDECGAKMPYVWACINNTCGYVGCGRNQARHALGHFEEKHKGKNKKHFHTIFVNLQTGVIWCYACDRELLPNEAEDSGLAKEDAAQLQSFLPYVLTPLDLKGGEKSKEKGKAAKEADEVQGSGLVGLENLGNTCYMNAALQCLSNCPPLTNYMLNAPAYHSIRAHHSIADTYQQVALALWKGKQGVFSPTDFLRDVKQLNPMFRGYAQQDSQEFLRFFLDRLHEEIKRPIYQPQPPRAIQGDLDAEVFEEQNKQKHEIMLPKNNKIEGKCEAQPQVTPIETPVISRAPSPLQAADDPAVGSKDPKEVKEKRKSKDPMSSMKFSIKFLFRSGSPKTPPIPSPESPPISAGVLQPAEGDKAATSPNSPTIPAAAALPTPDPSLSPPADLTNTPALTAYQLSPPLPASVPVPFSVEKSEEGIDEAASSSPAPSSYSSISVSSESSASLSEKKATKKRKKRTKNRERSGSATATSPSSHQGKRVPDPSGQGQAPGHRHHHRHHHHHRRHHSRQHSKEDVDKEAKGIDVEQPKKEEGEEEEEENGAGATKPAEAVPASASPPRPKYKSIISETFEGHLNSTVKCQVCAKVSVTNDPFYDLSVQIFRKPDAAGAGLAQQVSSSLTEFLGFGGQAIKLTDCLEAFFSTEELTGNDQYYCGTCKTHTDSQKTFRLQSLPEVLCIHLKRFRHDSYFSSKINTPVTFPLENLNLRSFCAKQEADKALEDTKYDLIGIINHRGGLGGGHYVAYCLNDLDGNWYEFDDSRVSKKSPSEIEKVEAYLLFYRRKSPRSKEEMLKQLDAKSPEPLVMISKLWINRWLHTADPGPVSNFDFLCEHGGHNSVIFGGLDNLSSFARPIPKSLFESLVSTFGFDGAHLVDQIKTCFDCEERDRLLKERRAAEKSMVSRLETRSVGANECWFIISLTWVRSWQAFLNGGPVPGPVSNGVLLTKENVPKKFLKVDVDYIGVNRKVWDSLLEIYGGGPPIPRDIVNIYSRESDAK